MRRSHEDSLRWYRNTTGMLNVPDGAPWDVGAVLTSVSGIEFVIGLVDGDLANVSLWIPFALVGTYLLIAGFRAGAGVGRDGVCIRSVWGGAQWIPWPEIERFSIIRRRGRGEYASIAVIFVDNRTPVFIGACSAAPRGRDWTKANLKLGALQSALENARGSIPNLDR